MSSLGLYFILMLDRFLWLFVILAFISLAVACMCMAVWAEETKDKGSDNAKVSLRAIWSFLSISAFLFSATFLLPSTKQAILIWSIPTVINSIQSNQKIQAIPDKLLTYINQELDSRIKVDKDDK